MLTNTVSSVLGNTVTVIAAFVAMLVLNWQLTLIAVCCCRCSSSHSAGSARCERASRRKTQESLSEMTAITQETLSVSGILLSKSFTRQNAETARYSAENDNQI